MMMDLVTSNKNIIVNSINGLVDSWLQKMKDLWIPKDNPYSDLMFRFKEKFPIAEQISLVLTTLIVDTSTDTPPEFNITYMGATANIMDFTAYAQYKTFVQMLIVGIAWFMFLRRLFKRLPSIIGGFGGA